MTIAYVEGMTTYCASISYAGRTMQIAYRSPRLLVQALRDMGKSQSANLIVKKIYTKG